MHNKTDPHPMLRTPTEAEIRAYAHELYVRSGWVPDRELENWREAEAWLSSHPPVDESVPVVPPLKRHRNSALPAYQ